MTDPVRTSPRAIVRRVTRGEVSLGSYWRKARRVARRRLAANPVGRVPLMASTSISMSVRARLPTTVRYDRRSGGFFYRNRSGTIGYLEPSSVPLAARGRLLREHFLRWYVPVPGDTVVELGAGVGTETVDLARLVGPSGRVVAVEANPRVAAVLRRTLEGNGLRNCTVIEAAIGEEPGTVTFVDEEADVSGFIGTSDRAPTIHVPMMRLDDLLTQLDIDHVDLLKSNIEGGELPALRAATASVLPSTEHVAISCHDFKADRTGNEFFRTRERVAEVLTTSGFTLLPGASADEPPENRDTLFAVRGRAQRSPDSASASR